MFQGVIDSFRAGGWGMYPTLLFGTWAVALAARYAARPRLGARAAPGAVLATLCAGLLGTTTGVIRTLQFAGREPVEEGVRLAFVGVSESLSNLALALILITFTTLLYAVGRHRDRSSPDQPSQGSIIGS